MQSLSLSGYLRHGAHFNSNCTHSHTRKHTNKSQNKFQSPATSDFPKSMFFNIRKCNSVFINYTNVYYKSFFIFLIFEFGI